MSCLLYPLLCIYVWGLSVENCFELSRHNECVDRQTDGKSYYYRTSVFSMKRVISIQIQHDSKELWPGHGFWLCTHFDLDHYRYDLTHGHDIPSVHGQLLCKILSRSNVAVRSYAWTRNLPVFTVTFTLEIKPLVMAQAWHYNDIWSLEPLPSSTSEAAPSCHIPIIIRPNTNVLTSPSNSAQFELKTEGNWITYT